MWTKPEYIQMQAIYLFCLIVFGGCIAFFGTAAFLMTYCNPDPLPNVLTAADDNRTMIQNMVNGDCTWTYDPPSPRIEIWSIN